MKQLIAACLLTLAYLTSVAAQAQVSPPVVVQFKFSPWGIIDADEDDFDYIYRSNEQTYEKYDMTFERSLGLRLFVTPFYIAATRSTTHIDDPVPDALVETYSVGFGGVAHGEVFETLQTYLMGGFGAGTGHFQFKEPSENDWESFAEVNAEVGFLISEHLLLGVGVDWQHFGRPGESKASFWNLYLGTSFAF